LNPELPAIFQSKITRQAIATCIDRQQIIAETPSASANVPNSYLPAAHPRYHAGVRSYPYDPAAAAALFDAAGWLDLDANPATARTAQGVVGVEDGAPLAFVLLTTPEEERQKAAISIQASLADCGVQVQIEALPAEQLFLSGPEGRVFGRQFQMVQFSWAGGDWPLCNLFTSQEIPGDYPQFSKGWGGANLSGYSNPDYDQACVLAQRALLGTPESSHQAALVQSIFSEDLPMVPLYFRQATVAAKADLCGPLTDPVSGFTLWNLEGLSVNGDCAK
jgi:ABC-type transport system substrate-binding protein